MENKKRNDCGVFENGREIFTTEQIDIEISDVDFTLRYEGVREPDIVADRCVYEGYIKYLIDKKLKQVTIFEKYRKYSCKDEISSSWILTENGFRTFASRNKEISLQRKYKITVEVREDEKAYLWINTGSIYYSNLTVADYLSRGIDVLNLKVKNDWAKNTQSGIITEISEKTVTDSLGFCESLKIYYVNMNQGYRVENIPDDTPVINVRLKDGKECCYYPQALIPILTREKVGEVDSDFSNRIDEYVKRDMRQRVELDIDFIRDIGILDEMGGVAFETTLSSVETFGYREGRVDRPVLICGNGRRIECGQEFMVFNNGFYQKPNKQIRIGYLYPRGSKDLMKSVANAIYSFAVNGKYQGEKDKYIIHDLLDIQTAPMIQEEYALGSILDYKRAANKLAKIENMDMVIALVPDGMEDGSPYNPFKTIWAEANIPSQMITMKTARLFERGKAADSASKYYLFNIVLGILGKTGGIPWIVNDMPGNVDLFIGLDVATVETGIHYPACSVVFDKYGRLLGFYKPKTPQRGEKIDTKILEDIYSEVLLAYEEKYGEKPKNIVIHRDGFSNENDEWYRNFFAAIGIEYTIVEVRKNIDRKLVFQLDGEIMNPPIGYCVYNQEKGYLVTTDTKNKKGSPCPLLIEKKCGNVKMAEILTQILYLSQLHVGSTQKMRLPITTGYADKICKNREYVPEGKVDDKLFFL